MTTDTQVAREASQMVIDLPRLVTETRLKVSWSQTEIAEYVGCHRNSVSSFERGQRKIPYDLAARLLQWIADVGEGKAVKPDVAPHA